MEPDLKNITEKSAIIETVDQAIFNWLNEELNLFCTTKKGWEKIPIMFGLPEKSFQAKNLDHLRDCEGGLILPLINIVRKRIVKSETWKVHGQNVGHGDGKPGVIAVSRRINQEKTSNFQNNDHHQRFKNFQKVNKRDEGIFSLKKKQPKVVYETFYIPLPTATDFHYEISFKTQFKEQMNQILQPLIVYTKNINAFQAREGQNSFSGFFEEELELSNDNGLQANSERFYETKIKVKLVGELIGGDVNDTVPKYTKRENAVSIVIDEKVDC